MAHRRLAVSVTRGVSLSALGPGTSALKSCIPPTPRSGSTAMVSTMMPMPPSQCVRLRQSRNALGTASICGVSAPPRIVAPVVVKPLMTSKKASVNSVSTPVSTHGSAPTSDSTNHAIATMAKPSRTRNSSLGLNPNQSPAPTTTEPTAVAPNAHHSGSP